MTHIDDRICPEARPYLVVATDKSMSGWGDARGRPSVAAWACYSHAHRQHVEKWVRSRPEMLRVRLVDDHDGRYRQRQAKHTHIYATRPPLHSAERHLQHLCALAVRNERDLYDHAMRAFRAGPKERDGQMSALAQAIAERVRSPSWSSDNPEVHRAAPNVVYRVALEIAHEHLRVETDTQVNEATHVRQ